MISERRNLAGDGRGVKDGRRGKAKAVEGGRVVGGPVELVVVGGATVTLVPARATASSCPLASSSILLLLRDDVCHGARRVRLEIRKRLRGEAFGR